MLSSSIEGLDMFYKRILYLVDESAEMLEVNFTTIKPVKGLLHNIVSYYKTDNYSSAKAIVINP